MSLYLRVSSEIFLNGSLSSLHEWTRNGKQYDLPLPSLWRMDLGPHLYSWENRTFHFLLISFFINFLFPHLIPIFWTLTVDKSTFQRKPACGRRNQLIYAMWQQRLQICKNLPCIDTVQPIYPVSSELGLQKWDSRNETAFLHLKGTWWGQPHPASFQVSREMCRRRFKIHVPFLPLTPTKKSLFLEELVSRVYDLPKVGVVPGPS